LSVYKPLCMGSSPTNQGEIVQKKIQDDRPWKVEAEALSKSRYAERAPALRAGVIDIGWLEAYSRILLCKATYREIPTSINKYTFQKGTEQQLGRKTRSFFGRVAFRLI
jgi:hypothetical protein